MDFSLSGCEILLSPCSNYIPVLVFFYSRVYNNVSLSPIPSRQPIRIQRAIVRLASSMQCVLFIAEVMLMFGGVCPPNQYRLGPKIKILLTMAKAQCLDYTVITYVAVTHLLGVPWSLLCFHYEVHYSNH